MMDMTITAHGDASVTARTILDGEAGAPRDVAELVRQCSQLDGRQGFRVVARGVSGHIFFEQGRVTHAEFGEDCGLRAVVEMLRAGSVLLEPAASWPSQPSLHLGPDLLLSMTGKDASRVVRKVDFPGAPPPLPNPEEAKVQAERRAVAGSGASSRNAPGPAAPGPAAPGHAEPPRSSRRAISGVMPRMDPPLQPSSEHPGPMNSRLAPGREPGAAAPKQRVSNPSQPARSANPPDPAQRAVSAPRLPEASRPQTAELPTARPPAELPITRAQKARSRSIVVARAARAEASSGGAASAVAVPQAPIQAPRGQQPTTMVRIASRGDLLAARGENAEQLAEAAAFIHGLANLIAADFGRQGRANVHLSGHGVSLLVARSEVNDIAAALGPTERVASLLSKVGLK
jgi:hypothetical protein